MPTHRMVFMPPDPAFPPRFSAGRTLSIWPRPTISNSTWVGLRPKGAQGGSPNVSPPRSEPEIRAGWGAAPDAIDQASQCSEIDTFNRPLSPPSLGSPPSRGGRGTSDGVAKSHTERERIRGFAARCSAREYSLRVLCLVAAIPAGDVEQALPRHLRVQRRCIARGHDPRGGGAPLAQAGQSPR